MASPKPLEPLVRTSVTIFERQSAWLKEQAGPDERSVSHLVRKAIDCYQEQEAVKADEQETEEATAGAAA